MPFSLRWRKICVSRSSLKIAPGQAAISESASWRRPLRTAYTLGVAAAGVLTVNPHLNRAAMSFDPLKDLVPVTLLAEIPFVLVASQKSEISSVADLIAKARRSRKTCRSVMAATARPCT